jgi:hypothetical protein
MADYEIQIDPIVVKDQGSVGNKYKVTILGWIQADSPSAADAAVLAFTNQPSGSDLVVSGIGGEIIFQLLAATCMDGGPDFAVKVRKGGNAARKMVELTATATTAPDSKDKNGNPVPVRQVMKLRTDTRADGLLSISGSGTAVGNGTATLFATYLASFRARYPWPNWVVTYQNTAIDNSTTNAATGAPIGNTDNKSMDFTLNAVQQAGLIPSGGGTKAVEGEITTATDRDEQHRKTTITRIDLLLSPGTDPTLIITALTPAGSIYRQSVSITTVKEVRVQASFTVLAGTDSNLLNFAQELSMEDQADMWKEMLYEGAAPVAVLKPTTIAKFTQSGSATALNGFLIPPKPVTDTFAAQPKVTFRVINDFECQTSWSYPLLYLDGKAQTALPALLTKIGRPANPQFYPAPAIGGGGVTGSAGNVGLTGGGTVKSVGRLSGGN